MVHHLFSTNPVPSSASHHIYQTSWRKRRHLKSPRSLTVSSASRSCFTSGHPVDPRPFRSMTIGPPIPEIQFDLENSMTKVKVKGTLVSVASSWLISSVFHTWASYRLPSLSFPDNWASHSRDKICAAQRPLVSHQLDQPFLRRVKWKVRRG